MYQNFTKILNHSSLLIYQTEYDCTKIDVRLQEETVWLTQKTMAELFQTSVTNINMHLKNIFDDGELMPDSVIKDFLISAADGKNYQTKFTTRKPVFPNFLCKTDILDYGK